MKKTNLLLFRLSLVLIPIMVLLSLEFVLRLFNLFEQEPLFLPSFKDGKKVYQVNTDVGKRYFDPKQVTVPNLYPETYSRDKSAKTFRIFCLGGSTTAGFPFDFQVPFPAQLKILLSNFYPDSQFEIINLGLSAINSFSVLDFIPEILQQQPDLIIIYMGHNEFYGAFGSASAISIGQNGTLIRSYLELQKLHLVQMIRSLISAFSPVRQAASENTTLMEQVIADKKIIYGSDKYQNTLLNFKTNLSLILEECKSAGCPVLIGNLVSNIKDLAPFGSQDLSESEKKLTNLMATFSSASESPTGIGHYQELLKLGLDLFDRDILSAEVCFRLGQISLQKGDSLQAKKFFNRAKDRDLIQFRANEDFNQIIKEAATTSNAIWIDLKNAFELNSPSEIIGNELICDHLHPNPYGYYLMALNFAAHIQRMNLVLNRDHNYRPPKIPYFVTDLDWDIGLLKVFKLKHRWPFADRELNYDNYQSFGEPQAAKIAYDYLLNHHNWVKAHSAMAEYYLGRRLHDKARVEYLAIHSFYPDKAEPLQEIAETFELEEDWENAEKYYQAALPLTIKKGIIYYQLAMTQWKQKKLPSAVQNMQMAIVAEDLTAEQKKVAKYNLAGFFIEAERRDYAQKVLEDILAEDPNFKSAQELLKKEIRH